MTVARLIGRAGDSLDLVESQLSLLVKSRHSYSSDIDEFSAVESESHLESFSVFSCPANVFVRRFLRVTAEERKLITPGESK